MLNVLFVVHLFVAIALVAIVLLQRSEGGALGIGGGGGGGMSGLLSGRSTANLLTRTTAILAAIFIVTSLALAKLSGNPNQVQIPIPAATGQPAALPTTSAPPSLPSTPAEKAGSQAAPGGEPASKPAPSSEPAPPIAR